MTNQEIIDLAAQFDLITFGPQDLVFFAREIEKRTIERCAKTVERDDSMRWSGAADVIRLLEARAAAEKRIHTATDALERLNRASENNGEPL